MANHKLLICGDSYMSFDRYSTSPQADMHWSLQLSSTYQIDNRALAGASNTMINLQLINAITESQPDYIVLGFTWPWRLEFSMHSTSSCAEVKDLPNFDKIYQSYITTVPDEIECHKNLVMADHAVKLAKSIAPTVIFLNGLENTCQQYSNRFGYLLDQNASISLLGHSEWHSQDHNSCSFHINDANVHLDIAKYLKLKFNTLTL